MIDPETILEHCKPDEDPAEALVIADYFLERENFHMATSALDRAWGLDPSDQLVSKNRQFRLDQLSLVEHGIRFRYVPAGTFLMGSVSGEPDELPVHPKRTGAFWMSETPITWAKYCELMGWSAPPEGLPQREPSETEDFDRELFNISVDNRVRLQYCETYTLEAQDWHAHQPDDVWSSGKTSAEIFGEVDRSDLDEEPDYSIKPMVALSWTQAADLGSKLSSENKKVTYRLPTEAEWEKAARGGLIGKRYSWGNEPPERTRCDFDHFGGFFIDNPKRFPTNGYGLYGMCGGVWEWTSDNYDALAYDPNRPPIQKGQELQKVIRGGSWSDCAEAITVSFRNSERGGGTDAQRWGGYCPNIGFRLCRTIL